MSYGSLIQAFQEVIRNSLSDTEPLTQYLEQQRGDLVRYALTHCPFYRDRARRAANPSPPEIFENLPPLSKRDLQQHFLQLWSDETVEEAVHFWMTSGSTGEPTRFIVDAFSALSREVSFWLTQQLIGNEFTRAHRNQPLMLRLSSNESGRIWHKAMPLFNHAQLWKMSSLRHPDCDMKIPIAFLRQEHPLLLGGDPQALLNLVDAWQEFHPRETRYPFPLQSLTCGGSQLLPCDRHRLEDFFGVSVTNTYALSEVSIVASECRHGNLHVHAPINWVEVLDESGSPVAEGGLGEIVVTNLTNWAFPFIRYRTGDLGRLDATAQCPCGCVYPILFNLQGRANNRFRNREGQPFSPMPLSTCLHEGPLYQYQLVQHQPDQYSLRYIPKAPVTDAFEQQVRQTLEQLAGHQVHLRWEPTDILQEPGQKFQPFLTLLTVSL